MCSLLHSALDTVSTSDSMRCTDTVWNAVALCPLQSYAKSHESDRISESNRILLHGSAAIAD